MGCGGSFAPKLAGMPLFSQHPGIMAMLDKGRLLVWLSVNFRLPNPKISFTCEPYPSFVCKTLVDNGIGCVNKWLHCSHEAIGRKVPIRYLYSARHLFWLFNELMRSLGWRGYIDFLGW